MSKIKMIVLFGEAGAGKDTCLHQVCSVMRDDINEVISTTTRPPREGEINGKNYHFMSVDAFMNHLAAGDFLEQTTFRGWMYGTQWLDLDQRKVNICVMNPEGVRAVERGRLANRIDPVYFWIQASDKNRLLRQLNREQHPDCDEIVRRYTTDKEDFKPFYDGSLVIPNMIIINNDYMDVAQVCKPIVGAAFKMAQEVA